jgi:hypothetical protein
MSSSCSVSSPHWCFIHLNITYFILGEHGDREWVSNGGKELIWLKHDICRSEVPMQPPSQTINVHFLKNEGQEGKIGLSRGWVPVGRG